VGLGGGLERRPCAPTTCDEPERRGAMSGPATGGHVEKNHADAESRELVEHNPLRDVIRREAVRAEDEHGVEHSCRGAGSQAREAGPIEIDAVVPVVDEDMAVQDGVVVVAGKAAQRGELRPNCRRVVERLARIQSHVHAPVRRSNDAKPGRPKRRRPERTLND
jgi:hypothetical protein